MGASVPEHHHPRLGFTSSALVVFLRSAFPLGCYAVSASQPPDRIPAYGNSLYVLELLVKVRIIEPCLSGCHRLALWGMILCMSDYPRTLLELQHLFPDETACARHLGRIRWPEAFECPF